MNCYELFLRSFYDGNGDGIGDLAGLYQKLEYISELGIECVWMLPIMKSPAFHGYTISNFYEVNPVYGSLDDLKKVISKGHSLGLKFVLDIPVNHVAVTCDWFQRALKNEKPYVDWFLWSNEKTDLSEPRPWGDDDKLWHKIGDKYFYATFGPGSPDLNFEDKALWQEIKNIFKFWLDAGFDGFRLDAAKHIFDYDHNAMEFKYDHVRNIEFWREMLSYVKSLKNDALIISEVWDDPDIVKMYDGVFEIGFNFPFSYTIKDSIKNSDTKNFVKGLRECFPNYLEHSAKIETKSGNFLTNHDMIRVMSELESEDKVRMAFTVLYTLPGVPFIFYGEELGMKGVPESVNFTEDAEEPMHWYEMGFGNGQTEWKGYKFNPPYGGNSVEEQLADGKSLYYFVKDLIKFRKENVWIENAKIEITDHDKYLVKLRLYDENHEMFVYYNFSPFDTTIPIDKLGKIFGFGNTSYNGHVLNISSYSVMGIIIK